MPEGITWEEATCPRPKKRKRKDEVSAAKDKFSTESNRDAHITESRWRKVSTFLTESKKRAGVAQSYSTLARSKN